MMTIKTNRGQAAVELAVLGGIILFCVAQLVSYGERLGYKQQLKMQAFRYAMNKAYNRNSSVNYVVQKDVRNANLYGGHGQGNASVVEGTANVSWNKGTAGPRGTTKDKSFLYYRINDYEFEVPKEAKYSIGADGSRKMTDAPLNVWLVEKQKNEAYYSEIDRDEGDSKINNTDNSVLQENVTTTLHLRWDEKAYDARDEDDIDPEYEYDCDDCGPNTLPTQGAYLDEHGKVAYGDNWVNNGIYRQRIWETQH